MSLVDFGKRLLECAKLGDTEEVRLLMTNGAPFTTDWLGASPLHVAAEHGHATTAEVFLRAGICRDARTKVDRTPLHVAAQEGHMEVVELLIKHGAEINAKDMLQMTPLHWAVERGHVPVIKYLLKHNAEAFSRSKFNKMPVDIAEDNCMWDIVKILQDHMSTCPKGNRARKSCAASLSKPLPILPKPTAAPFKVIKTDVSNSAKVIIKKERTDNSGSDVPTTVENAECSNVRSSSFPRPALFKADTNVIKSDKDVKPSCSDSDEGDLSDQSCTNVLTTLAALAEATAPNATISTQEALQWLETHGITMVPSDNSTIVASALEGGQTVSLTEAGKLALTFVKEHKQLESNNSVEDSSRARTKNSSKFCGYARKSTPPNQVITIVTDKSQIPSIISARQSPVLVVSSQGAETVCKGQPQVKKVKREEMNLKIKTVLGSDGVPVAEENTPEEEKLLLQKELEKMRREAARYKAQLLLKEHEAEAYRKQLEELKSSGNN